MLAVVLAATSTVLAAAPASAAAPSRGPVDTATGFPSYYSDGDGLALQLCLDSPNCPAGPAGGPPTAADLVAPDGEGFYYSASATAGGFDLTLALEAAFLPDGANPQVVFQRTQRAHRLGGLQANTLYTVTDPYGSTICTSNGVGAIPNNACRTETGGLTPQDFDGALGGRINPFLTWDTLGKAGAPPAGYVGDGITPHLVTGSPTGFNSVRVEGIGANETTTDQCLDVAGPIADCVESSLFVVSGKVMPGASATLTPSSLDFPNTPVGGTTPAQTSTYKSNGTEAATLTSVTMSGDDQDFLFTGTTCTAGTSISSGGSCTVKAVYNPKATGQSSATVTIVDNTLGSPRVINLTGSSVGVLEVAQTAVDFGTVKVGVVTPPKTVTVKNTGLAALSVSSPTVSGPYTAQASACGSSLSAGASCNVVVSAKPTQSGPQPGSLTISSGSAQKVLTLSGNAATGASSAAPSSVGFPATQVGSTTAGTPITVSNSGPVPMTVGTSALSGADAGQFVLNQGTCANTAVQPGSSCVLVVQFAPRKPGVTVASLLVPGEGGSLSVPLSGTGIAAAPPVSTGITPTPAPVTSRRAPVVDTITPSVRRHTPAARATLVRRNAVVTLTFSEAVSGASRHTVALFSSATGKRVLAFVSYDRRTHIVTLDPLTTLAAHSRYRVIVTPGIRDLSGNSLTPSTWAFTTRG